MWRQHPLFRRHRASLVVAGSVVAATTTAAAVLLGVDRRQECLRGGKKLSCDPLRTSTSPRILRKRTTLGQATVTMTTATLEQLRRQKTAILQTWERDEEDAAWRALPARAWPPVQPEPSAVPRLAEQYETCLRTAIERKSRGGDANVAAAAAAEHGEDCNAYVFQTATTLVFYGLDPERGFRLFQHLADSETSHVDSKVACGILLVEGLGGIPIDEKRGIEYLEQAATQGSSSQALYELGTIYYVGLDGVVEEDEAKAFALFEKAAALDDHTAALYMMADCLATGEGTPQDISRAVPLFYRAAERGHRFARQRIRELLASTEDETIDAHSAA